MKGYLFPALWILMYGLFIYQMWTDELSIWAMVFVTSLLVKEMLDEINKMLNVRLDYWKSQR